MTKCDSSRLRDSFNESFQKLIDINNQMSGSEQYAQKTIEKRNEISDKYKSYSENLKGLVEQFNDTLDDYKQMFIKLEYYGIKRYPGNLPVSKTWWQKLISSNESVEAGLKYPLVDQENLKELSSDPVFIKDFKENLLEISSKAGSLFKFGENEIQRIIPNVKVRPTIPDPDPSNISSYINIASNLSIITMNMKKIGRAHV